jgi:uncharacterized protein (TIGR02597 family)
LGAALACSLIAALNPNGLAQVQTTTDPVGFITLDIAGTAGTMPSQLSFRALGLTRPIEYQGKAENLQTNTLTDNEATWTDNQFNGAAGAFFVEITSPNTSPTAAGTTYDITATAGASKTITVSGTLPTGVDVAFKIRKHWTIASVFGPSNEGGLQDGTIQVYNGSGYDSYFYSTGGLPGTGWRKAGDVSNTDQANTVLLPDEGLVIQRQQSAATKVVLMGAVKTGQTSSAVIQGLNFIGNVYAAPMTLGSSGLYTGNAATGVAAGTASTADQVLIYNGSTYNTYFYSNGGLAGTGWRKVDGADSDQAGTPLPVGSSVIIKRRNPTAFYWVAPQHPTNL